MRIVNGRNRRYARPLRSPSYRTGIAIIVMRFSALADFEEQLGTVQHKPIVVQDITAEQNERLLDMGDDFDGNVGQLLNAQLDAIRRDEEDLPAETDNRDFIERHQAQVVHELTGNHRPVGRCVELGRLLA